MNPETRRKGWVWQSNMEKAAVGKKIIMQAVGLSGAEDPWSDVKVATMPSLMKQAGSWYSSDFGF